MDCINRTNGTNVDRATWLFDRDQYLISTFIEQIKASIGQMAEYITGGYEDNRERITAKLDKYDRTFNRDNGESILQIEDSMKC